MSTLVLAARPTADPIRLREMIARGHVLGDLATTEEVARELRIAAEETLNVSGLQLYLRQGRGAALAPLAGSEPNEGLPRLVGRVAREARPMGETSSTDTRQNWAWPLLVGDRLIGVAATSLDQETAAADTPDLLGVLLGVAAHAFERALLMESRSAERRLSVKRLSCLNRAQDLLGFLLRNWSAEEFLGQVADSVREGLEFRLVLIRIRDEERGGYVARVSRGIPSDDVRQLFERVVVSEELAPLFVPAFRLSRSYFIGHQAPVWKEWDGVAFVPDLGRRQEGEWHADDCLLVPIEDGQGQCLGYISVDDPVDRQPPSRETVEVLEMLADLTALCLERNERAL